MKLAALLSGGKDSTYALYLASKKHEIKYLVTIIPERKDSYMFHAYGLEVIDLFSESMNIPLIKKKSSGIKEKEIKDLKQVISSIKEEINGVVSGAIASTYQKERIVKICEDLNLKNINPLWHQDPEKMLRNQIKKGFKSMIISVAAEGLDEDWLGRKIDLTTVEELKDLNKKHGINIVFEGGEAETLVLDCPLFEKKIKIIDSKKTWDGVRGYLKINKAKLVSKNKKENNI